MTNKKISSLLMKHMKRKMMPAVIILALTIIYINTIIGFIAYQYNDFSANYLSNVNKQYVMVEGLYDESRPYAETDFNELKNIVGDKGQVIKSRATKFSIESDAGQITINSVPIEVANDVSAECTLNIGTICFPGEIKPGKIDIEIPVIDATDSGFSATAGETISFEREGSAQETTPFTLYTPPSSPLNVYMNNADFDSLFGSEKVDYILDTYYVKLNETKDVSTVVKELETNKYFTNYSMKGLDDFAKNISFVYIMFLLLSILFIIIGLAYFYTTLMGTIDFQIREIITFKSFGFSDLKIMDIYMRMINIAIIFVLVVTGVSSLISSYFVGVVGQFISFTILVIYSIVVRKLAFKKLSKIIEKKYEELDRDEEK